MPGLDEIQAIEGEAANIGAPLVGAAQFFSGLSKEKKDQAALNSLKTPFFKIQDEYYQNRNQAEALAGSGLPPAQRDYMTQGAQQGLGAGLSAILQAGGDVNAASMLVHNYNNEIGKIGAEDAAQHLANIQYFHKLNSDLAGEKTKQWTINEYQPYEAKLKELKQNVATDEANKWGGLTSAISSGIGAGTASQNSQLLKRLYSNNSSVSDPYAKGTGFAPATAVQSSVPTPTVYNSPAAGVGTIDPGSGGVPIQYSDVSDQY